MRGKSNDQLRLIHIAKAIETIENHMQSSTGFDSFKPDTILFDAVIRQLSILGEAANHLTDHTQHAHPEVPWAQIVSLRNIVMHEYFGIDPIIIWKIIHEDLPQLKVQIHAIMNSNPPANP